MGPGGPVCSRLVAGFWRLRKWDYSTEVLDRFVRSCIDHGVTTMDHADIYGDYTCEEHFGRVIGLEPSLRQSMQIVTKCGIMLQNSHTRPGITHQHYNTGADCIITSVDRSLAMLQTDYLDVLLIHRPDTLMNADETAEAFQTLARDGKVKYFGVSNFTNTQTSLLQSRLPFPLITNQIECSVFKPEPMYDGILDYCQQHRINPMAWSPLGGGQLFNEHDDRATALRDVLSSVGREAGGFGPEQVALAWLLHHPSAIFPVLGTGKTDRIASASASVEISLSREQWYRIWSASTGKPVP